jgi:hypothetical protein
MTFVRHKMLWRVVGALLLLQRAQPAEASDVGSLNNSLQSIVDGCKCAHVATASLAVFGPWPVVARKKQS